MKRILSLVLALTLVFSLSACGMGNTTSTTEKDNDLDLKNSTTKTDDYPLSNTKELDNEIIDAFVGDWDDRNRCFMTIEHINDDKFTINIKWSSSAMEGTEWTLEGKYDTKQKGIEYKGNEVTITYDMNDETAAPVETTTKAEGILYIDEISGDLYWERYSEEKRPPYVLSKATNIEETFETDNFNSSVSNVKEFTEAEIYTAGLQFMQKAIEDTTYSDYYWEYVKNVSAKKENGNNYTATFYVYSSELKSYRYLKVHMIKDFTDNLVFCYGGM